MATSVFNVGGILEVRLPELKGTRDARGRFTAAQGRMRNRNAAYARELQAAVVRLTDARITRRSASTNRLVKVTADPRNAQYDTWSAGVGVVKFLDGSIARYWRTFEEGSEGLWKHPFVGTQLMPRGKGAIPFPVAHGKTPGLRTTQARLPWMDGRRYVVKHEIAPRGAYRDAIDIGQAREFGRQSAQQLLAEVLGRDIID